MNKKSKSKKRGVCLDDLPITPLTKPVKAKRYDPGKRLRDPVLVGVAFFAALQDNDIDAALDILDGYLMATGKMDIARDSGIAPSTIYHALSHGGNPTLKTVARILQAAA